MSRRLVHWATLLGAGVALFAIAWWLGSRSPAQAIGPMLSPVAVAASTQAPARDPENERLRAEVARLESALKREGAAVDDAIKTNARLVEERDRAISAIKTARVPYGADRPLPFPPDAPAGFRPSEFKAVSALAADQCGMNLEVVESECSEYPCIAFMRTKADAQPSRYSMDDCAPWTDALGGQTTVRAVLGADGGMRGFAWMPVPPSDSDRPIALYRARDRIDKRLRDMGPW